MEKLFPQYYKSIPEYYPKDYFQITQIQDDIMNSITKNIITFISSPTGSGKSTQIPQWLASISKRVICVEPRSIATNSISEFIQRTTRNNFIIKNYESDYYNINYNSKPEILILRENTLLKILNQDPYLSLTNILLIDEVHERSMNLELILYYLKFFLLPTRKADFKLIITSATLDIDSIKNYFLENSKIQENEIGTIIQTFDSNYEIIYRPIRYHCDTSTYNDSNILKFNSSMLRFYRPLITQIIQEEMSQKDSIIGLIFLPDYKSIYFTEKYLSTLFGYKLKIIPFFGSLQYDEQLKRLQNSNKDNTIVLSTTLAESCLTIPKCDFVIDLGVRKYNQYNYETNIYQEYIDYISQDSAIQRSGRSGRNPEKKGTCYRLYKEEIFNKMEKHKKPEVSYMNIDLLFLKMANSKCIDMKDLYRKVNEIGHLDFMSEIKTNHFNLIINGLKRSDAINNELNITPFGEWLIQSQLDLVCGKMIYDLQKDNNLNKDIIRTISLIQFNQSCELFYSNVDPKKFKPKWINELQENKEHISQSQKPIDKSTLRESNKKIPKVNFISKAELSQYNKKDYNDEILPTELTLKDKLLYKELFTKLDEVYNANSFYSKNKIFTLGDLMTNLFFVRQYRNMKCSRCFANKDYITNQLNYNKNNLGVTKCDKCNTAQFFYCYIYSLNEKYFHVQYIKYKHILKSIGVINEDDMLKKVTIYEQKYAFWNHVYLLLISLKPFHYLSFKFLQQYLQKIKNLNFDLLLNELYIHYKTFYDSFYSKIKSSFIQQFQIMRKDKENLFIYYNINDKNEFQRGKLSQTYFIQFFEKTTNSFFSLVRFSKSHSDNIIYHKNINPIFNDESLSIQPNNNFNISLEIIPNIGPFFYYNYLVQKMAFEFSEFHNNSLCFITFNDHNNNMEKQKINEMKILVEKERETFIQRKDDIKCLKQGCLTLQMSQGFKITDLTTDKEEKVYEIQLYLNKNNDDVPIDTIYEICYKHNIKYKKLFCFNNKIYISFKHNTDCIQFNKFANQYLDFTLIPKSSYSDDVFKLYAISFESHHNITYIRNEMVNYLSIHNLPPVFVTQPQKHTKETIVYYCINTSKVHSDNMKGLIGSVISNSVLFRIPRKTYYTYKEYENDFFKYLHDNYIDVTKLNFGRNFILYKIENYNSNNRSLIDYYINETEMQLNNFAIKEIKSHTKDTFVSERNFTNLKSFENAHNVHIEFVYIDNKIVIYGAPKYREKVVMIITKYLETLSKEKKVKILYKEQILIIKHLQKEALSNNFLIVYDNKTHQIEYRDKYSDIVNDCLGNNIYEHNDKCNYRMEMLQCEICLEELNVIDKEIDNVIQLRLCGHYFCVECLKMQIINQIKQGESENGIHCIKCNLIIANSDIKEIFSLKEIEQLSYNLIKNFMSAHQSKMKKKKKSPIYKWCSNPYCEFVYNITTFKEEQTYRLCPNCDKHFCLFCEKEITNFNTHYLSCTKKLMNNLSYLDRKWLEKNTKGCPKCLRLFEKSGGCNHMTCTYCKPNVDFCFICGLLLESSNPLKHYSDPQSKCCNRLYEELPHEKEVKIEDVEIKEENEEDEKENEEKEEKEEEDEKKDLKEGDNEEEILKIKNDNVNESVVLNENILKVNKLVEEEERKIDIRERIVNKDMKRVLYPYAQKDEQEENEMMNEFFEKSTIEKNKKKIKSEKVKLNDSINEKSEINMKNKNDNNNNSKKKKTDIKLNDISEKANKILKNELSNQNQDKKVNKYALEFYGKKDEIISNQNKKKNDPGEEKEDFEEYFENKSQNKKKKSKNKNIKKEENEDDELSSFFEN